MLVAMQNTETIAYQFQYLYQFTLSTGVAITSNSGEPYTQAPGQALSVSIVISGMN